MAAKYKENSVYYYQIVPSLITGDNNEVKSVKRRFKKAFKFKGNTKGYKQGDGSVNAIEGSVFQGRYVEGAIIFTLERNLPPKIDKDGKNASKIELSGFRGLGYDSVYFYDSELMVLAIESRVPGVTISSLRSLIYINQEINTFDFKPIGSPNEYDRFLKSEGVTGLEMEVLNIDSIPKKHAPVKGVSETIDLVEAANGTSIQIKISSGLMKSKKLNKQFIKTMLDYALKSVGGQNEVSKFKLNIVDIDSGKVELIDMITGRIRDKTKIEKVKAIDRFSIAEKVKQIKGLYLKRRLDLEKKVNL